jgi:glycosyltransferase involved in cell wall biosynthesis
MSAADGMDVKVNADPPRSRSALHRRSPLERDSLRVSVLIPVFNEVETIGDVVRTVRGVSFRTEIICVNDASTDGSGEILDELAQAGLADHVLHQVRNQGKGAAIRAALAISSGDIVIVQDADLEYDPVDWERLFEPLIDGRADAVFGSRFLGETHRVLFFWHALGNRLLTLLSNMLTDLNLTDMETGYKAMRGDVARTLALRSNRFGFEPEVTARLARARARIYEVPISYTGRTYAEGKKITWRDGVAAVGHILRYNLLDRG